MSPRIVRSIGRAVVLLSAMTAPSAGAVQRHAFMTSITGSAEIVTWPGATGTTALERADSVCRSRAAAAGLDNASLYRAWLSTSTTDAYCHVQGLDGKRSDHCKGQPLPGGGPWYTVNGAMFTGTLDELVNDGVIYQPLREDELGVTLPPTSSIAWTSTTPFGTVALPTCSDWTSGSDFAVMHLGNGLTTAVRWTDEPSFEMCGWDARLLCFESGTGDASVFHGWPGALMFITSAAGSGDLHTWTEAHGAVSASAGYEICKTTAAQGGLPSPGAFVPWLSTDLVPAASRVTVAGPFNRPDGFPIAFSKADLLDGTTWESVHQFENGSYLEAGTDEAFTGTLSDGTHGETCASWTSANPASSGTVGLANYTDARWTDSGTSTPCNKLRHLYCISNVITLWFDGFERGLAWWSGKTP